MTDPTIPADSKLIATVTYDIAREKTTINRPIPVNVEAMAYTAMRQNTFATERAEVAAFIRSQAQELAALRSLADILSDIFRIDGPASPEAILREVQQSIRDDADAVRECVAMRKRAEAAETDIAALRAQVVVDACVRCPMRALAVPEDAKLDATESLLRAMAFDDHGEVEFTEGELLEAAESLRSLRQLLADREHEPAEARRDAEAIIAAFGLPRFGVFRADGRFSELADADFEGDPRAGEGRWVGGKHDQQLVRCVLSYVERR